MAKDYRLPISLIIAILASAFLVLIVSYEYVTKNSDLIYADAAKVSLRSYRIWIDEYRKHNERELPSVPLIDKFEKTDLLISYGASSLNTFDIDAKRKDGRTLRHDFSLADSYRHLNGSPIIYHHDANCYILINCGPDNKVDIDPDELFLKTTERETYLFAHTYDPTNGVYSSGDIWAGMIDSDLPKME